MKLINQPLDGLKLFERSVFSDSRGFFSELHNAQKFEALDFRINIAQTNFSRSLPGVVRGLHFQLEPPQGKLVTVIRGEIWDVAVDIRRDSKTFGSYFGTELSDKNGLSFWLPAGFAHGFVALGNEPADVLYFVDGIYNAKTEGGIRWNDPDLNIPWPHEREAIISERDQKQMTFAEFRARS